MVYLPIFTIEINYKYTVPYMAPMGTGSSKPFHSNLWVFPTDRLFFRGITSIRNGEKRFNLSQLGKDGEKHPDTKPLETIQI